MLVVQDQFENFDQQGRILSFNFWNFKANDVRQALHHTDVEQFIIHLDLPLSNPAQITAV